MTPRILGRRSLRTAMALIAMCGIFESWASAQDDRLARPLVYRVPGMDRAVVKADTTYKSADGEDLKMDIYMPPGLAADAKLPAVLFIHGGYLPPDMRPRPKDWGVFTSYGRLMAASGLVGVTFNHRYYGWDEKNFAQSLGDVSDAIAYVRAHAEALHVDPQRICLWAFSGGGPHLTVALREPLDYIRCIVAYYAILDLGPSVRQTGSVLTQQTAERYSPVQYIKEDNQTIPPIFIARAGLDSPDINRSVEDFVSRAFAHGVTIEVANHPAGRHGFDVLDDDARSREIIARTIEFIKAQLLDDRLDEARNSQRLASLRRRVEQGDIDGAKTLAKTLGEGNAQMKSLLDRVLSEQALNLAGYALMQGGNTKAAVAMFEWVVEGHPESPNAFDSLAEGYEADGRKEDAIVATQKALSLIEKATGPYALRKDVIKRNGEARLRRLK